MTLRKRSATFWGRHRTLFWMIHSAWALATGVAVVILARERYAFVPWVVVFLGITWLSTLLFGRNAKEEWAPTLGTEVTSYITRSLYQETLFFLLPFYAYSTVLRSPNVLFLVLLGGLAVVSCLDLVFDRWLRTRAVFGFVFFAAVAFAAVNLLIPILFGVAPRFATPLAALVAVATSLPMAFRTTEGGRGGQVRMWVAALAILGMSVLMPALVPPVPLRLKAATFATDIDRASLVLADSLGPAIAASQLPGRLVVLVEVFSPRVLPSRVHLEWRRGRETIRIAREVDIVAHESSFRLWDALSTDQGGLAPGRYQVIIRTAGGRWLGRAVLILTGDDPP
jgi:hypothetical protein